MSETNLNDGKNAHFSALFIVSVITSNADEKGLEQLSGHWLNKRYIEALVQSKSSKKLYNKELIAKVFF